MTIKQQGGIFGRNPTFNNVTVDGTLTVNGEPISDFGTMAQQDADAVAITGGTASLTSTTGGAFSVNQTGVTNAHAVTLEFSGGNIGSTTPSSSILKLKTSSALRPVMSVQDKDNNYKMWVLPHGDIAFANGAGIDFSATSGTGTSELFDDYEEGTWTGTYGGSTADGSYTKIGRLVYAAITLAANSESFSTISGLPFTSATAGYEGGYWGRCLRADILDANGVPCRITVSGTSINFHTNAAGGADGAFTVTTDASGAVRLGLSVVYYV